MGVMHGEYKTPGGKLVVVDLVVVDERIRRVMVSGDFFLYPEEAIDDLTVALDGASIDSSDAELASRIWEALPAGTEMMGFSPEAVVIAVRRALG